MEWVIGWWRISIQRVWPTTKQLTQMYDRVASDWHNYLQRFGYTRAYTKLFKSLRQSGVLAHLQNDSTVCDCGIGSAAFSLALAKAVPVRLKITGVDISPVMVSIARQNLDRAGVNACIECGDVRALQFEDNTFDLAIAAHMLEHLSDPATGLREMVRVLRPQAPLILSITRRGLLGSLIQLRWGNGCFETRRLLKMMTDAGLTDICFHSFTFGLPRYTSIICFGFKNKSDLGK